MEVEFSRRLSERKALQAFLIDPLLLTRAEKDPEEVSAWMSLAYGVFNRSIAF